MSQAVSAACMVAEQQIHVGTGSQYDRMVSGFAWKYPKSYNLGGVLCSSAPGSSVALRIVRERQSLLDVTFAQLDQWSNRLANLLKAAGCVPGDRVAVLLPPSFEAAIAHLAVLKGRMITMPLFPDAVETYADRLNLAKASVLLTDRIHAQLHSEAWAGIAGLRVIELRDGSNTTKSMSVAEKLLGEASDQFRMPNTRATDPAFLSFTSGSEGPPKGVVQSHALVEGILPALLFTQMPKPTDIVWSTFDWGWLGGLLVPLGAWRCGAMMIIHDGGPPSPGRMLALMEEHGVTRLSIVPTALRMLRLAARGASSLSLNSITSGGEKLGGDTRDWVRSQFGIECSELYGLSECSAVIGSGFLVAPREGALGKPAPGQSVSIVDEEGRQVPSGEVGQIAVAAPHPAMFTGYWRSPTATRDKFCGSLLLTGDIGLRDEDGYFHFISRADDIIKRAGYRIGPAEIEQACCCHPAVRQCVAFGVPDFLSGEAIVLWVELGASGGQVEETDLLATARKYLASYKMPSRIRIVEAIPCTANGKTSRRLAREAELALVAEESTQK